MFYLLYKVFIVAKMGSTNTWKVNVITKVTECEISKYKLLSSQLSTQIFQYTNSFKVAAKSIQGILSACLPKLTLFSSLP